MADAEDEVDQQNAEVGSEEAPDDSIDWARADKHVAPGWFGASKFGESALHRSCKPRAKCPAVRRLTTALATGVMVTWGLFSVPAFCEIQKRRSSRYYEGADWYLARLNGRVADSTRSAEHF